MTVAPFHPLPLFDRHAVGRFPRIEDRRVLRVLDKLLDGMVRADGDDVGDVGTEQVRGKGGALAVDAVGDHRPEEDTGAPRFLDQSPGQHGLGAEALILLAGGNPGCWSVRFGPNGIFPVLISSTVYRQSELLQSRRSVWTGAVRAPSTAGSPSDFHISTPKSGGVLTRDRGGEILI